MADTESRVKAICQQYLEVVSPLAIQLEIYDGAFPVEILNEIRALFAHLSKSFVTDSENEKERNVGKAESHLKRAILDCFKYLCVSLDDRYKKFEEYYKHADLSLVSDGEFLPTLLKKRATATEKLLDARKTDLEIKHSESNLQAAYLKYENAYLAYDEVDTLITASYEKLENVKKKSLLNYRIGIGGFIVGALGLIVGLVGLFY
jgi:hypothetical protein